MIQHHRLHRLLATTAAAATLGVAGCSSSKASPPTETMPKVRLVAALTRFDACDAFLRHVKDAASSRVGPYGLGGAQYGVAVDDVVRSPTATAGDAEMKAAAPATRDAAGSGADGAPVTTAAPESSNGEATSATNNQEAAVDEADIVKTDGTRIVSVRNHELIVTRMQDGAPSVSGRVDLGRITSPQLFLVGDRAYVTSQSTPPATNTKGDPSTGTSEVVEVDLSSAPKVTHRVSVDGTITEGRLANGTIRLVLTTPEPATLGFVSPAPSSPNTDASQRRATEQNRQVIQDSTIEDWVPTRRVDGGASRPLTDCDDLYRPAEFSGFSMLSILTITDGVTSMTSTGLLADGGVTYASTGHLYVATSAWTGGDRPVAMADGQERAVGTVAETDEHTDVHSFAIAGREAATYEASGRVAGHVLNQYALSERDDHLRIATTTSGGPVGSPCPPDALCKPSAFAPGDSRISVLTRHGESLDRVGMVDGLGVGEQIKAVRYVDSLAYVVTFRQTDPFYVVDLSKPTAPRKLGELHVPGFSNYLHPVDDHAVLGIGVDGTGRGMGTGGKLSVYDTSNPVAPAEVTTKVWSDLTFTVGNDPHAFHWDAARHLAFVPYLAMTTVGGRAFPIDCRTCGASPTFAPDYGYGVQLGGILVVHVDRTGMQEIGRITHLDRRPSPAAPTTTTTTTTTPTTVPETTVPETTVPATTVPATTVPDTTAPAASGDGVASSSPASPPTTVPGRGGPISAEPYPGDRLAQLVPPVTRVFLIGDRVITLSDAGIAAHDVADLHLVGYAAF